ncbi:hypothetical protein HMPREF9441_01366 [Paraprevotella clara YIT 11840]|uniref:Uncharacterized protein n=1 Tax=Paraprevotella clara YIT 11840 TaxID=762968 RepID=G5SPT1_9BACT|nr:hypothetical protein HMPREF9441_01366 [Paraprevotella clara YIT 11840]
MPGVVDGLNFSFIDVMVQCFLVLYINVDDKCHIIIYWGKAIPQTTHRFCAKRFSVLSQTIFQPAEIDFRMY